MDQRADLISRHGPSQLFGLENKTALLVGGYGALGSRIAWFLAEAGATVAVVGRNESRAQQLASELEASGYKAFGLSFDATLSSEVTRGVEEFVRNAGTLDILINCLGLQREEPLLEVTEGAFDDVCRVNLKAAMFLAQAAARQQIVANAGGRQIHLLSIRARLGLRGRGYSAYCASKGAQLQLVRQHAAELAPYGITVNGVAPSMIRTHKNEARLSDPETCKRVIEEIPIGRIAVPDDVAGSVLFLASAASSFVTGQILTVDGGVSCCQ